ncbi:chloride channel CLIC-like protein 1 isoform X2 [Plectropomus leopardus]|uniref:chloride channel CLIC-like protein 1 isoform X2 n=1 Tax=Plectropomus leopardus TaxID=160734 RepID=UPI001C4B408F|nr:chloride channel CLIC-like protein 1 isoform X2 [Plectropomus leopardus]
MLLIVLVCSLCLAATAQEDDDDWIDPYDMINYDSSTKTMRKPAEPANYDNVPTKRREYNRDSNQVEVTPCNTQVMELQRQNEELRKKITLLSQQPTCNPVFKRFLTRLRNEIEKVGLPSDSTEVLYDAKILLSKQTMTEIQNLLVGADSFRTGALDKILVDLRPHDYEAWKWRFEDTFGVELDTLLKLGLGVMVIVAIICTQLWSQVSWFIQFSRLFGVSFLVSIPWNWIYLYKIAFAEHQRKLAKMNDAEYAKCTGLKKFDWSDNLKEWFRSTLTLQDDPCKKYYENLDPWLLVPPTKAFAVTITTFITEPLEHIGEGISKFLRALLKDLPITLQIPVLFTIVLAIVVCMYGSVQAAFRHGITAPFRRPRRDPPPPQREHRRPRLQEIEDIDHLAEGDAPRRALKHQADNAKLHRNQVHRRRPYRPREEPAKVAVETLRTAEPPQNEYETDAAPPGEETNLSAESDSENQQETQEELEGATAGSAAANRTQTKTKPTESDSSPTKTKPLKVNKELSHDEPSRDGATRRAQPAGRRQDLQASAEDRTSSDSLPSVETVGVPVQETSPTSVE